MADQRTAVRLVNSRHSGITLVIEPWGEEHPLAPGAKVDVVATGPAGGKLEIEWRDSQVLVHGWGESRIRVEPAG